VNAIHLAGIRYTHGQPHSLSELGDMVASGLTGPDHGLASFRASDQEIWQLAAAACESTLADHPEPPDLLIYVSENERQVAGSLARIADRLGLPTVDYLSVSGHGCGNLGLALRVAREALHSGARDRVLLVLADRALDGDRIMLSGLSVFSDGAASCVVTRDAGEPGGPVFKVESSATVTRVELDSASTGDRGILSIVSMAVDGVARIVQDTGYRVTDFSHVIFANYRVVSQKFLASAMGLPADRLLIGPVGEFAHCFSADILVNLDMFAAAGQIKPGGRVLASATGPYSWSMIAAECVQV
jgi:3-oxoacyl-[acyl-carrier-protein] synthase III